MEHLHPEPLGAARDRLADAPEADDPERRPGHLRAERAVGLEGDPLPLAHVALALGEAPREREQEREGEVGRRVGQDVGGVADGDAALGRRVEVDVVGPDRVVGDRAQLGRRGEQLLVDGVGEQGQQTLDPGDVLAQLVTWRNMPRRSRFWRRTRSLTRNSSRVSKIPLFI